MRVSETVWKGRLRRRCERLEIPLSCSMLFSGRFLPLSTPPLSLLLFFSPRSSLPDTFFALTLERYSFIPTIVCLLCFISLRNSWERDRHFPREHVATVPIDNRHQIDKSPLEADVCDITTPDLIASLNAHAAQQIRIPLLSQSWHTCSRFGVDCLQTHQVEQSPYPFAIHQVALRVQPGGHLAGAVKRRPRVLFIQQTHQQQIFLTFGYRLVVITGASQTQQLALCSNAQIRMPWLNQRSFGLNAVLLIFFPSGQKTSSTGMIE